jgi:hypothetical protein
MENADKSAFPKGRRTETWTQAMLRCLFWKINRKPLAEPLQWLSNTLDVDLRMLAECNMENAELLQRLNAPSVRTFIRADE